jgi:hypothetical protein
VNKGALRGIAGQRPQDSRVISTQVATSTDPRPPIAEGMPGDVAVAFSDFDTQAKAYLWPPKTTEWSASPGWGAQSESVPLPYRTPSQRHSNLMPGWSTLFADSWMTGTAPADMSTQGTFGGAYYTSSAGTAAYIGRTRSSAGTSVGTEQAPMPFFSMELQVTTLPEATRYAWAGQLGTYFGALYGYAARVDSAGAVELWLMDGAYGNSRIGTGTFTISANDLVVMERFGYRITVGKVASGARDITSSFISNVRNANVSGYDGFASTVAGQSYGYAADSASVRVGRLEFSG